MEELLDEIIEELRAINPWITCEQEVDDAIQAVIENLISIQQG